MQESGQRQGREKSQQRLYFELYLLEASGASSTWEPLKSLGENASERPHRKMGTSVHKFPPS